MSTSTARTVREDFTLADAWLEFWKYPSPWMIGATLVVALTGQMVLRDWQITDALVPTVMVAVRMVLLIFIPWQARPWVLGGAVAIALLAFPRLGLGLTYLVIITALGLGYEWTQNVGQRQQWLRQNCGQRRRNSLRRSRSRNRSQRFAFRVPVALRDRLRYVQTQLGTGRGGNVRHVLSLRCARRGYAVGVHR